MSSVMTNQRHVARTQLAEAGIRQSHLHRSSADRPIVVHGKTIDIKTVSGELIVHFCRSTWNAEGISRKSALRTEQLRRNFHVKFACAIPEEGKRYSADGLLYFDRALDAVIFTITALHYTDDLIPSVTFLLNDLYVADIIDYDTMPEDGEMQEVEDDQLVCA